jgi:hypothetical protein
MIAKETCASHVLSSTKIMADFSEPAFNLGRTEARGSIEGPVSKDGASPATPSVMRTKVWRSAKSRALSNTTAQTTPGARICSRARPVRFPASAGAARRVGRLTP